MVSFGFGKKPKHRKFDYLPRYYDEDKERLEQTLNSYKGEARNEQKVKARISSGLRQRYRGNDEYRRSSNKKSNLRIVYILIVLFFISYMILSSSGIQRFIEGLEG